MKPGSLPYRLTYWKGLKGRGDLVAQTLHLAGVPFEWIDVTDENLEKIKEDNKDCIFFNLPLFSCSSGKKYTETIAIMTDIALYRMPDLLGKTIDDKVQVATLIGVSFDARTAIQYGSLAPENPEGKIKDALNGIVAKKLGMFHEYLKDRIHLVGDYTTLADICFYTLVELARNVDAKYGVNAFDYGKFDKHFNAYRELPGVKEYLESELRKSKRFLPYHSKIEF